ncbi:MAG: winged helix-turn-helix transcriptional regulator [Elusimicrobia bacterium]|nr:winged helix-turn-helix transcriptional regulator [Elusimicrobiota bacterium]
MPSPDSPLAEKEFLLIQQLSRKPTSTQRDLSRSLGLSLGTTNLLIRRLARKGIIKVTQLDWKRTQYLLTLKGAVEQTRKAYNYALGMFRIFKQIQDNITTVLTREYRAGRRHFILVAQDEILELVRDTVRDLALAEARFTFVSRFDQVPPGADLVLTATLEPSPASANGRRYMSLMDLTNIDFRIP